MTFERNIDGIDVILRIDNYESPSKHDFGDWWCDCGFSFRMGKLAEVINYRKDHDELLTPEEVDSLADALTALLDGKTAEPREMEMTEPDFVFMLYPIKDLRTDPRYSYVGPGQEFEDIHVEWRVHFWDGAPTDSYLAITLFREDIIALRDFLNDCRGEDCPDTEDEAPAILPCQDEEEESELQIRCFYADAMDDIRAKLGENVKAWALILDQTEDADLKQIQIMAMIFDFFLRDDEKGFADTHLVIVNEPGSGVVRWERTSDGYAIHLSVSSGKDWCDVGHQLGYAMMHCLIDHMGREKPVIPWAEEFISEAVALYLLEELRNYWDETPFSGDDPDYGQEIENYIDGALNENCPLSLELCQSYEDLCVLGKQSCFEKRIKESHVLYMSVWRDTPIALADVREYASDHQLLLYTHYWRGFVDDYDEPAVDCICGLQERISGCELPKGTTIDIDLRKSQPERAQLEAYGNLIRTLRILPVEQFIFEFLNSDTDDGDQVGLVFYQVTRERDSSIQAEIRLDTEERRTMYRLFCDDDRAVRILNEIVESDGKPDLTGWLDITEEIFPKDDAPEQISDEE